MTRAFIALGSNLGKRQTALRAAIEKLRHVPQTRIAAVATFRETDAVDSPPGAPAFINSAVEVETELSAEELLRQLLRIERDLGRERAGAAHHAPRTMDLDLVLFGDVVLSTPELTLPHPFMHTRRFVLEPLAEIAPDVVHPPTGMTVGALLAALEEPR